MQELFNSFLNKAGYTHHHVYTETVCRRACCNSSLRTSAVAVRRWKKYYHPYDFNTACRCLPGCHSFSKSPPEGRGLRGGLANTPALCLSPFEKRCTSEILHPECSALTTELYPYPDNRSRTCADYCALTIELSRILREEELNFQHQY